MLDLGIGINVGGIVGTLGRIVLFGLAGLLLYLVGNWILEDGKYNKHIILRKILSDNRKQYSTDKAKQVKTADGIFWKLKKT